MVKILSWKKNDGFKIAVCFLVPQKVEVHGGEGEGPGG